MTVRENIARAKKRMWHNVLLRKTIFPSELKVTCSSLSRSRAALPLNATHSLAMLKRQRGKVQSVKLGTSHSKNHMKEAHTISGVSLHQHQHTSENPTEHSEILTAP